MMKRWAVVRSAIVAGVDRAIVYFSANIGSAQDDLG